ncbi:hypothetical protein HD806DRAFT_476834 [Xylariaceae sp. AK1471]|nr:hypothetical protein HD806DRAFT_476834 [Xylariaceae sp. AK1471]
MSGLEVLGAAAAAIELFKVARSCLSICNDLRKTKLHSEEQTQLQFQLVAQSIKFERWCEKLGVQEMIQLANSNPQHWAATTKFTQFETLLTSQLRFKNNDTARLTITVLENVEQKFAAADKILTLYVAGNTSSELELSEREKPRTWFSRKIRNEPPSHTIDESVTARNAKSKHRSSLYSTARWVSVDKNAIMQLLSSIEKLNNALIDLLPVSMQAQVGRTTNIAILNSANNFNFDSIRSFYGDDDLGILMSLKRWKIREREDGHGDVSSKLSLNHSADDISNTRIHTYPTQDFKRGTLRPGAARSLSVLDGNSVIVEWKYYSNNSPFRIEHSTRLASLVGLLNHNKLYNRFLALPCKGLVNDGANSRVGLVFSIGGSDTPNVENLLELMQNSHRTAPPLGERFRLARDLVVALSSLHSVQWLHKSLRSDNIIILKQKISKGPMEQAQRLTRHTDSETDEVGLTKRESKYGATHITSVPEPLPPFYLLGWDLSRPDHPSELSETLSISTSEFQSKRDRIRLYSHPELSTASESAKRARFQPQFDIYSMGLVLLEIGLWRPIETIRHKNLNEFRERVHGEYCDKLLSKMGQIYWRAVQRYLYNDFSVDKEETAGDSDFSLQVAFEKLVVSELERCCA